MKTRRKISVAKHDKLNIMQTVGNVTSSVLGHYDLIFEVLMSQIANRLD